MVCEVDSGQLWCTAVSWSGSVGWSSIFVGTVGIVSVVVRGSPASRHVVQTVVVIALKILDAPILGKTFFASVPIESGGWLRVLTVA